MLLHRKYSEYQVWQFQDLCFLTELKLKNKKAWNQQTKPQTNFLKGNNNKTIYTKNKQLFPYHLAHPC